MLSPSCPTLRYIHPLLKIPPQIQRQIFPDTSLSILDFLKFPLPVISSAASQHTTSQFFSNHASTTEDVITIQKIPIPLAKTVTDLVIASKAAVLSGTQSVKCQHAPSASEQNLPVWVIPYWAKVLELHSTLCKAWQQAEEFIRLRKKVWKKTVGGESTDEIMQQAYDMLSCLQWFDNIRGFDHEEPLYKVATYASRMWLSTMHEDQILGLLHRNLLLQGSRAEIANMAFFEKLRKAYNCHDMGEYNESWVFAWIRGIGKALVAGERNGLGTMVNIGGDHWVAITLNFKQSLVWYRDSFGQKPVEEVTSVRQVSLGTD